jgi:hypothetical protein
MASPGINALLNDVAHFSSTNAGTGTVTLGALVNVNGFTMAESGGVDGQSYVFRFDTGTDFEITRCTYASAGSTLTRDTVLASKIAGVAGTSKITVTTTTTCRLVLAGDDAITRSQTLARGWLIGG